MVKLVIIAVFISLFICMLVGEEKSPKLELIRISGAKVKIGTPIKNKLSKGYHAEEAPKWVTVQEFKIGKYPITADVFCDFLNSDLAKKHDSTSLYNHVDFIAVGSRKKLKYSTITMSDGRFVPRKGAEKAPANLVTWKGAVVFCKWMSEVSGESYRLPSEAEWELAARGVAGREWPWGAAAPDRKHGNRYPYLAGPNDWPTESVGSYPANATPEGVCEMLAFTPGEWCAGIYKADATAQDLASQKMDLENLHLKRPVRGVWTKSDTRADLMGILRILGQRMGHLGRPWTREGADPIKAVETYAGYGFRIVRDIKGRNQP